jgi:hypothetical protein
MWLDVTDRTTPYAQFLSHIAILAQMITARMFFL